ncbi:hypothetical protein SAMN05421741_10710 [Paenimyroides ummariense]|uniref:Uncharacterized protein n=1 Tax=Paenimyroides ummariense TaxID=913024 RepID=A0A1I4ZX49_9FLAO|nr:hypothetical protein [Paenimyroides ummariense]SFN54746.1 hypothetical protein SAMN05421741_10710 [Paenimyroides ummariense]
MKKCYLLLSIPMLMLSCTNDFDESTPKQEDQANVISNKTTNSVSINLNNIVTELVTTYKLAYGANSNNTLSQKIALLEKVSNENAKFAEIKPADFNVPTEVEVKKFLFNYDLEYNNLKVSQRVKTYFNSTLQYENNLNDLLYSISVDEQLSLNEKNLLIFTVNSLNDLDGNDFDWKRRRIVAATLGFEKSSANAVFNVALLKINN